MQPEKLLAASKKAALESVTSVLFLRSLTGMAISSGAKAIFPRPANVGAKAPTS